MKITTINEITGRFGLLAKPDVYDAFGAISGLWIDKKPRHLSAERIGVAAALAFRSRLSGELSLEKPISPATAESIAAFLKPAYVVPTPVEFRPLMLPKGTSRFVLHSPGTESPTIENSISRERSIALDLRRSDVWAGAIMSLDKLTLATNAWLLAEMGHGIEAYYSSLAVAVLFAEDFDVDVLVVPDFQQEDIPADLVRLLAAARLGIQGE